MSLSQGPYLWRRHVPRGNSAIGLALCLAFAAGLTYTVVENRPVPVGFKAVLGVFLAAASWGAYVFGKWVAWPPLALAATQDGVLSFYNERSGNYGTTSTLIRWAQIESFSFETRVITRRRIPSLLVQLRPDGSQAGGRVVFMVWSEKGGG